MSVLVRDRPGPPSGKGNEMNEYDIVEGLRALLPGEVFEGDASAEVVSVSSFEEAGLMTTNRGVVVRFDDGSEFQLSVVQSKGTVA